MFKRKRAFLLASAAVLPLYSFGNTARAQDASDSSAGVTTLHEIVVTVPHRKPTPPAATEATPPKPTEAQVYADKADEFDAARDSLLPKIGVTSYNINHDAIAALPQGTNTPLDKVILQAPGVSQDSAASGALHVRNEHANVQYRINGVLLPDGIAGFGQVLDTGFVGTMALVTGALPAQYGLRTSGLFDITTRVNKTPGGSIGIYGGSQNTTESSIEYGGTSGKTEYFVSGRYLQNNLGIENPTSSINPIHDNTQQGKGFVYMSSFLDESTRLSFIGGATYTHLQIPNSRGQQAFPGLTSAFGVTDFDSTMLNETQTERNQYGVLALQKKSMDVDWQVSYFTRNSTVNFNPDPVGDLFFNGIASNVARASLTNGVQSDASFRINEQHTVRAGTFVSGERTQVNNSSIVLPDTLADTPFTVNDTNTKVGWLAGIYVQDEWKLNDKLTLNTGLRFDQMWQFTNANQLSPRASLEYKPFETTTLHAGYARYFTPPPQIVATPVNLATFAGTSGAAPGTGQNPVLPDRSHYFDAGIVQKVFPGLQVGVDVYYKIAQDLLDDGQFGQALVLSGFNYEKGVNKGIEFSATYTNGNLTTYGNVALAQQKATNVVSNQFLFSPEDLAYLANHSVYTDHSQSLTMSGGASYLLNGTRYSANFIYGSGLRADAADGTPNGDHVPAYTQVNVGASHEFAMPDNLPLTLRFDVVNLFDESYQLRDGSGIGVFAPQYGPRRGYFIGLSKKI
jgi:outer membrane receptor protein involved in Fe transport